jgi:hypothetical protein
MAIATSAVTESVSMMKQGNVTRKDNNRAKLLSVEREKRADPGRRSGAW